MKCSILNKVFIMQETQYQPPEQLQRHIMGQTNSHGGHVRWAEGYVNMNEPYFYLIFGKEFIESQNSTVVYIGPPLDECFPVSFVTPDSCDSDISEKARAESIKELDYFLCKLPAERSLDATKSWEYQAYHCSTAANVYGSIHWGYESHQEKESAPLKTELVHEPEPSRNRRFYQDDAVFAFLGPICILIALGANLLLAVVFSIMGTYGFYRAYCWHKSIQHSGARLVVKFYLAGYAILFLLMSFTFVMNLFR